MRPPLKYANVTIPRIERWVERKTENPHLFSEGSGKHEVVHMTVIYRDLGLGKALFGRCLIFVFNLISQSLLFILSSDHHPKSPLRNHSQSYYFGRVCSCRLSPRQHPRTEKSIERQVLPLWRTQPMKRHTSSACFKKSVQM